MAGSGLKRLERTVKGAYVSAAALLRYGTPRPSRVRAQGSDLWIEIDPADPAVRKQLVANPLRGKRPRNQRFWRAAVRDLTPGVALDIGMNFGECLFATRYPPATRLAAGFEANPRLRPFADRTRAAHPDRDRIALHTGLVGERGGSTQPFYIDRAWTGGSSAVPGLHGGDAARYERIDVPTLSVDQTLQDVPATGLLLFKIDTEGYEPGVLRGMTRCLDAADQALGLIEFDAGFLERTGEGAEPFWAWLQHRFEISAFDHRDRLHPASGWTLDDLLARLDGVPHTDLLVVRGQGPALDWARRWARGEPPAF